MSSDSDVPIFNLKEILSESMSEIKDISDEAYFYFDSLSESLLITKITRSTARKIARELLKKMEIDAI